LTFYSQLVKKVKGSYEEWFNLPKIFRYLRSKENFGLKSTRDLTLNVYVDADFGGDEETPRSTTRFIILIGGCPVSWYSKL